MKNYTGSIKRNVSIKKLNRYYYIIDYYIKGELIKTIRNYYTKSPLTRDFIKKYNILNPEMVSNMHWSNEPDEIIYNKE